MFRLCLYQITCDDWKKGVKDCRDGVKTVVKTFPQPTYDIGESILQSFYTQTDNLQNLTTSTSPILSSRAVTILEALSLLSKVDRSAKNLLYQLKKVYPAKSAAYCGIATKLSEFIGKLDNPINKVIEAVAKSIIDCINQFNSRFIQRKHDRCEKIDFKQMVKSARLNTNTIAFIAETALKNNSFADEAYEAIAVVSLISNLLILSVHGTNANMGSVLHAEKSDISPFLHECFVALDPEVQDLTQSIASASFDGVANIKEYLRNFVKIVYSYNPSLEKLLGPFEGVEISVEEVNNNLKKSH